jgi:SAM-dependent methyltransferase
LRAPGATEKEFGAKFARYRDSVLQFVKSGRSLDIGTATGLFPSLLKQAGFEAEGIEFNPESARWGQQHYGVTIRTCALGKGGEARESYDLISMTDVLEHTEHPLRFLQGVRDYLKPGGFMLITFPDITSPESTYLRFWSRVLQRDWIWSCCHIPLHVWEFTAPTARVMFHKAGFDVAGLRRSQEPPADASGISSLLRLPLRLLNIPIVARLAGTQMEFVIRKR